MADSEVRQKFEARTSEDLLQLALELYARAVSYDCAESVHAAAFAAREEILKRMSGFAAGMRAGEIAQREKADRNYARGFDHAVRDIVAALSRQFNQELNEDRKLGLHVALNTASGYHGFMDAEKSVPAAPEEKKP